MALELLLLPVMLMALNSSDVLDAVRRAIPLVEMFSRLLIQLLEMRAKVVEFTWMPVPVLYLMRLASTWNLAFPEMLIPSLTIVISFLEIRTVSVPRMSMALSM